MPQTYAGDLPVVDLDGDDVVVHEFHRNRPAGIDQCVHHAAVVHLVVGGQVGARSDPGGQEGLRSPALPGREPAGRQTEPLLVGQDVVGLGLVGGVDRDHQGAASQIVDRPTGSLLQGLDESGPGPCRVQVE